MVIRFFNYNTMEKVREFEAHTDYIRYLEVLSSSCSPTRTACRSSSLLSYSDGMQIKLWDWDKGWLNTQIFQVHAHYVMMCRVIVSGVAVYVIYIIQIYNWAFTIHKVRGRRRLVYISFF